MTLVGGDALDTLDEHDRLVASPSFEEPGEGLVNGLDDVLASLGQDERQVLRLRYVDDLGYAAIAARLGVTPGAVRLRAHRARRRLEALMRA